MSYSPSTKAGKGPPTSTARTWIAVFDGGRGAVFQNAGFDDAPNLELVFSMEHENRPTHELGRDKPGRVNIPGGGQAGLEPVDLHGRREGEFMDKFCARLELLASKDAFDRIVLLAPSEGIRRFRERTHAALQRLAGVLQGDYAHSRTEQIEKAFGQAIARPLW